MVAWLWDGLMALCWWWWWRSHKTFKNRLELIAAVLILYSIYYEIGFIRLCLSCYQYYIIEDDGLGIWCLETSVYLIRNLRLELDLWWTDWRDRIVGTFWPLPCQGSCRLFCKLISGAPESGPPSPFVIYFPVLYAVFISFILSAILTVSYYIYKFCTPSPTTKEVFNFKKWDYDGLDDFSTHSTILLWRQI